MSMMVSLLMFILMCGATIANLVVMSLGWHRIRRAKQREDAFFAANQLLLELCTSAWVLRKHKGLGLVYNKTVGQWWKEQDFE